MRQIQAESGAMSNFNHETVLSVHHWTDRLFSFRTTRNPAFRFRNGQFTMMGVEVQGKPLLRAYSLVSANYEDRLEFFSIKVQDGPLTSRLQHLKEGDSILVSRKATGTLVLDNLAPGRNLYLLGTGTGLAPFLSIIKDPETYERFERVIVVHGVRWAKDLAYGDIIENVLPNDELIGEHIREKLTYYPTVTREDFRHTGRISLLMSNGKLSSDVGLLPIRAEDDRFMLCGSPAMLNDLRAILKEKDFVEGNHGAPGHYVIEKEFVET
jgi:ferredoxin--NADP+ reductase